MHPTSFENMRRCWDRYVRGTELERQERLVVVDVGGGRREWQLQAHLQRSQHRLFGR